jgi:uncharacterized Zn finger protein
MTQARRPSFVLPYLQKISPARLQHALLMLATGSATVTFTQRTPTAIGAVVTGQDDTTDRVFLSPKSFYCTCPEVQRRQLYCAHIALVALVALQQGGTEPPPQANRVPQAAVPRPAAHEEQARSAEELLQVELAQLRAENAALKARIPHSIFLKVSKKGGMSIYGLSRFPITLYQEQWQRVLDMADEIRAFLRTHQAELARKEP